MVVERLIEAASRLRDDVGPLGEKLVEEGRIDVCYNPLNYAWNVHEPVSYTPLTLPTIYSV